MNNNQEFAPVGGMNQDDSIINPTPNMAGRNAFALGDYKYALNTRIGSSRSDNFNDLEILKGTVEVTDYKVRSQILNNSDFSSGLTGWSQIAVSGGVAWIVSSGVRVNGATSSVSNILYQAISTSQRRVGIRVKVDISFLTDTSSLSIVFLAGTTVLSTQTIITDSTDGSGLSRVYAKYVSVELPSGCNGIGVQAFATSSLGSSVEIEELKLFDWITGARPSGTEKIVGKREDKENNLLYYHVYNASGNHCIRFYDPSVNAIYELLKWSGLNYTSTSFVSSALIDNFYGFTDRINSPRLIDVWSISDLFLILGSSNFREYHISFHKWAPIMPPVIRAYWDGVTNNYKNFENKVYQFSYRYIYQGHLKSRWSPVSNSGQNFTGGSGAEITAIELYFPGFILDVPGSSTQYNYFGHDNDKFIDVVDTIEFAYRESSLDVWRILNRQNVKASRNTLLRYEGSSNSTPIPTIDFYQLFDTIPFLAGCIEAIDNRFVFADCLDEKDIAPPVQVTNIGVAKFSGGSLNGWWNAGFSNTVDNDSQYPGMTSAEANDLGNRVRVCDTTFKGRGRYKLGIQWLAENGWRSAVYTVDNWIYDIAAETGTVDKIYALTFKFPSSFRPPTWAVAYQIMRTNCLNIDYFMFGPANSFSPLVDSSTLITDNIEVPEYLRDRMRQHFENARIVTAQDYDKYLLTLSKNPFQRSVMSDVRRTVAAAALSQASRLYINVNNWYNSSIKLSGTPNQNNPLNKLYYNYREGDRIRFIGSTIASPTDGQKIVYDLPILEFTGIGIIVEKPANLAWIPDDTATTDPENRVIEVYTPKIPLTKSPSGEDDYLYHESGEWYPVLYPGTEQRDMAKRDWTFTNDAAITCSTYGDIRVFNKRPFSFGDCHGVFPTMYFDKKTDGTLSVTFYTSFMNPSIDPTPEVINIWEKNTGRSAPAYTDLPVVRFKPTQARFGGQAVEESFVNNINRFRDEDQFVYPSEYGRIRALVNTSNAQVESVGAIMLAIGERETFSIYVNRTTIEDLSGRSQVALSDKVLGSYNTLLGSHGTLNPESVSIERGRVYYWDGLDGSWIRYGRDGLTEISFYKMRNWFRELAALLINEYGDVNPVAISEYDPYNEELVTFINHSILPSTFRDYVTYKGSVFSETDLRWKECHSYTPDMFAKINTQLVSFRNGSLYLHEQNTTRSTFYGTKYDVMIEPVFNGPMPRTVKSHQAIAVIATHGWNVDRFLSEYRGAKTKQQSSIALSQFAQKEDAYYADIPRDINTPIVTDPIINGDKMRSKAIRALLKLDPSVVTESLLHYVVLGDIDSPKNPT